MLKSLDYLVDNFGLVGSTKKVYQARLSTEFRFESNSVDNLLADRDMIHRVAEDRMNMTLDNFEIILDNFEIIHRVKTL